MEESKFKLRCLNCGKPLFDKEKSKICVKCLLELDLKIENIDSVEIKNKIRDIIDGFISDVVAAFQKDHNRGY
ncbi:MAG: hypothetical protein ACTSSJ_04195 [Candidatus Odinarchaeia archaeon]